MTLESLLISKDASLLGVLRPTLEKLAVSVEVCSGAQTGGEMLRKRKFDAVIVDCDDMQGGVDLLTNCHALLQRGTEFYGAGAAALLPACRGNTGAHQSAGKTGAECRHDEFERRRNGDPSGGQTSQGTGGPFAVHASRFRSPA